MKLRVNLLKTTERRYQGPVSIRFLVRVGGLAVTVLLVLFVVLAIQRQIMLSYRLKSAKAEWARIGPRYEELVKKQAVVASYKILLDELNKWGMTNAHWNEMLLEMQKIVPPNVQLSRVSVDGGWEFVKPEKKKADSKEEKEKKKEAKKEEPKEGGEEKPAARESIAVPSRTIRLGIYGSVQGELADEIVVQFTKNLQKTKGFDIYFDTMELEKLYRVDLGREDGGNWRQFEIQGLSKPRAIP